MPAKKVKKQEDTWFKDLKEQSFEVNNYQITMELARKIEQEFYVQIKSWDKFYYTVEADLLHAYLLQNDKRYRYYFWEKLNTDFLNEKGVETRDYWVFWKPLLTNYISHFKELGNFEDIEFHDTGTNILDYKK